MQGRIGNEGFTQQGICYLCGKPLTAPIDRDHVPPRQLYAAAVRKVHNPNLLTIPVHAACNKAYQHDEDYFVNALIPFARGTYAGDAVLREVFDKYHSGRGVGLVTKVLREFERRPSGLVLPDNKVIKRFEGHRISRVAFKIIRGLYFQHFGDCLPDVPTGRIEIIPPDSRPPNEFFAALGDVKEHGAYPGVFGYKFRKFPEVHDFHYWGMLLWDKLIVIAMFHDPACACGQCTAPVAQQ